MAIHDFTTELFCRVDDAMTDLKKHTQAILHPSETVTLGLLFALKGVGTRAFYSQERLHQSLGYRTPAEVNFDPTLQKQNIFTP